MTARPLPSRTGLALAVAAVTTSYLAVRHERSVPFDTVMARVRVPLGHRADRSLAAATDLGSVFGIAGTATTLLLAGRRRAATDVVGAGMTAWTLAQAAKPAVARARPYEADLVERLVAIPAGSSWPSGHSAVAAAVGTTVASYTHTDIAGRVVGGLLAGFVGWSRIYVGVHHATDVVAGVGIGVVSAAVWQRAKAAGRRLGSFRSG